MKAYKCDRCGKFFEKDNGQKTSFFITAFNPHGLDLCPNCNAELQAWIANGKEQLQESEVLNGRKDEEK